MSELLSRALQGVDPSAPGAFWQIFSNLMGLLPWWPMIWFTGGCVLVGCGIAWYRGGSYRKAVLWALILGPFGWLISWYHVPALRPCPRCGRQTTADARRCRHCACPLQS